MLDALSRTELVIGLLTLAAFLSAAWWFRGQAPGQPIRRAPGEAGAEPLAWLGAVGLTLVAFGDAVAIGYGVGWSFLPLMLGYAGLIEATRRAYRRRHDGPSSRRVLGVGRTATTASLLVGVVVAANVLAYRYGGRPFDLTSSRIHSLSSLTKNQLHALSRPLRLTIVHGQDQVALERAEQLMQLLELFRREDPDLVAVDRVNRFAERGDFATLAEQFPKLTVVPGGALLVRMGEAAGDYEVLSNVELFGPATSRDRSLAFGGEDAIASTIARLESGERPLLVLTSGHGEMSPDDRDPAAPGLGLLRARLQSQGYQVVVHRLIEADLPEATAAVLVAGARSPFQPVEIDRLAAYLRNGGRGVFLLGSSDVGLNDVLASYQVSVGRGVVLDGRYAFGGNPARVLAPVPGRAEHPIVSPLANQLLYFPNATPLAVVDAKNPRLQTQVVVSSSRGSWVESDPSAIPPRYEEGKDQPGPVPLMLATTEQSAGEGKDQLTGDPEPRLVAISAPLMAEDGNLGAVPTNQDLLLNAFAWLRGRSGSIGIAPRVQTRLILTEDRDTLARILWVPTLLAFAIIISAAGLAYRARRA